MNSADELAVWRAAQIMIETYGEEVESELEYWINKAIEQDNQEGERAWKLVAEAVKSQLETNHTSLLN